MLTLDYQMTTLYPYIVRHLYPYWQSRHHTLIPPCLVLLSLLSLS